MAKLRFIVVGSGWRSLFYWRIAQALPERFELCAMLCRTEEKAEKMHMASVAVFILSSVAGISYAFI